MRKQVIVLAAALVTAPLAATAADLVVWWEEGYYAQENEAVREIITAFEQETGKQVEVRFHPEGKAIHRVVTEGISPEQAVNDAIARIRQILSE